MQAYLSVVPRCVPQRCAVALRRTQERCYSQKPTTYVKRVTLFKVPREEDIAAVLKAYEVLRETATRDGKPYVVSNVSRRVLNTSSPISDGYTVMSQSIFKNHSDHDFYDKDCPAHKILKKTTGPAKIGVLTIVTEGEWPEPQL